jgi:hypothetical protein
VNLKKLFASDDWKRVFAWIVVWGYAYDVIIWPFVFFATTLLTTFTKIQWPGPPLVPWEQLAVMTANLAVIGGVQLLKDREANKQGAGTSITNTTEVSSETETITKSPKKVK